MDCDESDGDDACMCVGARVRKCSSPSVLFCSAGWRTAFDSAAAVVLVVVGTSGTLLGVASIFAPESPGAGAYTPACAQHVSPSPPFPQPLPSMFLSLSP